jgi:hypothetical protein
LPSTKRVIDKGELSNNGKLWLRRSSAINRIVMSGVMSNKMVAALFSVGIAIISVRPGAPGIAAIRACI